MLANVPGGILLSLLIVMPILSFAVIVCGSVWGFMKAAKNNEPDRKKAIIVSLFSVVIAALSFVMNMGWIRFIMIFLMIPFIHATIFFLTNLFISCYTERFAKIRLFNLLFCITYLAAYIFLPDGGDYGELYFFFGLIHSDALSYIAEAVSGIAFLGHIVLFILQIIYVVKVKRKHS